MNSEQQYIDLYTQARQMIFDHAPEAMNAVRDQAFEDFRKQGFPSKKAPIKREKSDAGIGSSEREEAQQIAKVERYKYTDMQKLFAPDYGVNLSRLQIPVDPYEAFRCDVPNLSTSLYFVVNDAFYNEAEHTFSPPKLGGVRGGLNKGKDMQPFRPHLTSPNLGEEIGVPIVCSFKDRPDIVLKYYARLAKTNDDAITALNTMLAQDGLLVYVPKNIRVDRAIQVINILKAPSNLPQRGESMMVNRRVLIVLEEGAELKMLFCDHTADNRNFLATQVIEAYVGEDASLDLYCLEETHYKNVRVSNVYIDQQANSRVNHNVITLHNGITRNKLDLTFSGEGAECQCYGCVIADKQQHVDNNTLITHKVPHCTSNELYKYVLDDQSTGAFAGRVLVEHGAQKTSSQMTNQNLTATKEARMYTQPMLEIYADDVKCAHGSTVGQLNDAALFYMRQRGISLKEAKLLLQNAFINEVIDKMQLEPLRDRLHYLVEKRFRGELNKCAGCKLCK